jgi:Family of unknown function (DUF6622)
MNKIIGILSGTPLWVWALLVFLVYRGIKALKSSISPVYTIFIMPAIFLILSVQTLVAYKNLTLVPGLLWLISIMIGSLLGWLIASKAPIAADKKKGLIKRPGSPITLIIILLFFGVRYYFGYSLAVNPELMQSVSFLNIRLALSGLMVGVSLGSTLCFFYKYLKAPHFDLEA